MFRIKLILHYDFISNDFVKWVHSTLNDKLKLLTYLRRKKQTNKHNDFSQILCFIGSTYTSRDCQRSSFWCLWFNRRCWNSRVQSGNGRSLSDRSGKRSRFYSSHETRWIFSLLFNKIVFIFKYKIFKFLKEKIKFIDQDNSFCTKE